MADLLCRVCGEPWDAYHLRHDAPAWVYPLFMAGAGCESCEGIAPEGADTEAIAYRSDADLIVGGATDTDPLEERPAVAGETPPAWKRPAESIAWQCSICNVRVMRDPDWKEGHEFAYRVEGVANYYQRRDLGIDRCDTFPALADALEEISHDGVACRLCRYPCGDCSTLIDDESSYPDPRDEYHGDRLCEDCFSAAEYECALASFNVHDLCASLGYSRRNDGSFAARVGRWIEDRLTDRDFEIASDAGLAEIEGDRCTYPRRYADPHGRTERARMLCDLRRALKARE